MKNKTKSNNLPTRRQILKNGLYTAFAAGTSSFTLTGCTKKTTKKPNIILITVDTLRADHLGCYGYSLNTSPNIDQLAKDAVLFENCLSHAPVTSSSFASILSGFLPHETKVWENNPLHTQIPTLPKTIQQHGYKTIAVVSNYVLRSNRGWGNHFMIYDDEMRDSVMNRNGYQRTAEHTTTRAIELLKQFHKDKFFLWLHYQDPHGPYTPPRRFAEMFHNHDQKPRNLKLNKSLSGRGGIPSYQKLGENRNYYYYAAQYDREIRYMDEQFKPLIDTLKELGLYDNDLIIFSSDHGEGMGEHNYYFAHGECLYHHQTHIPLIVKYGNELSGKRMDFVQQLDIVPTVLNVAGIKTDMPLRGTDLRRQNTPTKEIFSEMRSPMVKDGVKFSLVADGMKLIYAHLGLQYELFDLNADPHEQHNLAANPDYRNLLKDMFARLKRTRQKDYLQLGHIKKPPKLTEEEIRKLKSIGYVGD